tara:strand:+ start:7932 stop:9152 length:1221 start_codon:yes stop_codon:yes gene_type:complete
VNQECDVESKLPDLNSRSNTGNNFRIYQALNKGQAKVLVLGGSVTTGHEAGGIKNAWPSVLEKENCTGISSITNRAVAATGSNYAVYNLKKFLTPFDWDIILLEYAVNDDDVGNNSRYKSVTEVSKTFEILIRGIHDFVPKAAVIPVECFRPSKGYYNGFMSGQNYHDIVSKYYDLPVISIREAIWHDYFELKTKSIYWKHFPVSSSHPTAYGQQIIADLVAKELRLFKKELPVLTRDRLLPPPLLLSQIELEKYDFTIEWKKIYNFETQSPTPVESHIGWKHVLQKTKYGDVKPGMMCNGTFPNALRVDITECKKNVQISYLKTYEGFGSAIVNIISENAKPINTGILQSRWDKSRGSGIYTEILSMEKVVPTLKISKKKILSMTLKQEWDADKNLFKVISIRCI